MNSYYVVEEDFISESKVYLGEFAMDLKERTAMLLGDIRWIPQNPLVVPVKYKSEKKMSDLLSLKFIMVSKMLKNIIDRNVKNRLFYRPVFLEYEGLYTDYYYMALPRYDCIRMSDTIYEQDERRPEGIRITDGFYLNEACLNNAEIFRLKGLSNRKFVISERLKEVWEENEVKGIQFTRNDQYRDW